jgi:hypothetical protein
LSLPVVLASPECAGHEADELLERAEAERLARGYELDAPAEQAAHTLDRLEPDHEGAFVGVLPAPLVHDIPVCPHPSPSIDATLR